MALGAAPRGRLLAQTGQTTDLVGCLAEPGIALFLEVFQGRSNLTSHELLPGTNWQLFTLPYGLVAFLYPPDWIGQVLFASTFSQNAAPQWTGQQQNASGIVSTRVTTADSTAAWEYAVGTLQGIALTLDQSVAIAEGGILGDGYTGTRLCMHTEPALNGGVAWLTAIERNGLLVLTNGTLFADASGLSPFSVLTYYSFVGPRAQFEQLMRSVFIPIQWQLLYAGGSDPTPTPIP